MTTSNSLSPSSQTAAPPFRWLNPYRPTTFRVIVGLGIAAIVLALINLFVPGTLGATAYLSSIAAGLVAYVLAEVLLVTIVVVGPFAGFVYGVIAFFAR
ncbi:hypothetical protein PMI16_01364 [Herbaspirillum sp. CF444]|uniref:hypothetical protein n=1 Tax=Herbaspirillum sp. CF444 TaxID=1144319 RepID=UPI0002724B9C|nr:hypothetical protein [Herbaspirillum sp. CF444]EJL91875.1 hypothetical protein PMI16_01364 [Herbaspirillum sp. CF444]